MARTTIKPLRLQLHAPAHSAMGVSLSQGSIRVLFSGFARTMAQLRRRAPYAAPCGVIREHWTWLEKENFLPTGGLSDASLIR
jgi:hypothetical protein